MVRVLVCVVHVQAVSNDLGGERIDNCFGTITRQLLINVAPADVASIIVDEDTHSMGIAVEEAGSKSASYRS